MSVPIRARTLEITRAATAAGKHILMEKPMCCNVAEGDEMVAAAENAGVLLMVAYMMRFDPGHKKLKSPIGRWHAWPRCRWRIPIRSVIFHPNGIRGFL